MSKLTIPVYFGGFALDGVAAKTAQLATLMGYVLTFNNGLHSEINMQPGDIVSMTATISPTLGCTITANTAVMNLNKVA